MAYEPVDGAAQNFTFDEFYPPRQGDDLYLGNTYYPRRGDTLWFNFGPVYEPPAGDQILFGDSGGGDSVLISVNFDLRAGIANQLISLSDSRSAVSNAVSGFFDTNATVGIPLRVVTGFDTKTAVINARIIHADTLATVSVAVIPATPDFSVPWGETPPVNAGASSGWKSGRLLTASIGMGWIKRLIIDPKSSTAWLEKNANDNDKSTRWNDAANKLDRPTRSTWKSKSFSDHLREMAWDAGRSIDALRTSASFSPPAKDIYKTLAYDSKIITDLGAFGIVWGNPPPKDILHRTVWGKEYYQEICWRHYEPQPGNSVGLNIHLPITLVDDGDNIRFRFDQYTYDRRCSWREPSGWRDAYFYIKPGIIPTGLYSRAYIMMHTAMLTRLPDRQAIDVSSITISTDWDSAYWSVKSAIGRDDHLAMLESTPDGPILVEASINSHLWNFQVDSWGTGQTFGKKSRSISGRSVSAQLGSPMADPRTRTESESRTASQLMNYELENTGWTAVIDGDDWLVSGNVFSYSDKTPMQIVRMVADAAGAMVYTDKISKTITVKPRYKVSPWNWASTSADIIIPSSMVEKIDGEWDERPFFNAAFVSGEADGISAKVLRTGSAGDIVAPMITDKLMTTTGVARAKGISILAASGKWSKIRMDLPVFASPAVPGVIMPGTILQFVDGLITWKGVVTAVSVSASWGNGLKVRQTIDIERYHGN